MKCKLEEPEIKHIIYIGKYVNSFIYYFLVFYFWLTLTLFILFAVVISLFVYPYWEYISQGINYLEGLK